MNLDITKNEEELIRKFMETNNIVPIEFDSELHAYYYNNILNFWDYSIVKCLDDKFIKRLNIDNLKNKIFEITNQMLLDYGDILSDSEQIDVFLDILLSPIIIEDIKKCSLDEVPVYITNCFNEDYAEYKEIKFSDLHDNYKQKAFEEIARVLASDYYDLLGSNSIKDFDYLDSITYVFGQAPYFDEIDISIGEQYTYLTIDFNDNLRN